MAGKTLRRAVHGTCVAVRKSGDTNAETLPSKVRVTLQRARGGYRCLGKKSRQVALFTFSERPRSYIYSYALLDLEKLFKYSSKQNTQIKICVEQRQGGKRVTRVPLEEFLEQLLCNGPCNWFFLYVHEGHITLSPSSHKNPDAAPRWAFEGTVCHKQESSDERVNTEEAGVVVDAVTDTTMNDTLNGLDQSVQDKEEGQTEECVKEQATDACVEEEAIDVCVKEEAIDVCVKEQTTEECIKEQVTLPPDDNITGKEETMIDNDKNEEQSDDDWITDEEQSLSENEKEENDYYEHCITDSHLVTGEDRMTSLMNNDLQNEVAYRSIPWSRLLMSSHGAVIITSFFNMVAVFLDLLDDWNLVWGWRGVLLMACYGAMVPVLLDFFEEED